MIRAHCAVTAAMSILGLSACGPSTLYTPFKEPGSPAKAVEQVQIVMDGSQPGCRAEPIGWVQGKSWDSGYTPGSPAESIRTLQIEAARHGANGIMQIKCRDAEDFQGSRYQCVGTAFVCVGAVPG